MKTILPLSDSLIMKIAAGEVIERPVFAVKELLENAIDAAADTISISLEDSGLKKITITDTGRGMSRDDIVESIKPHTTSKLQEEDELLHIKTMGFRGEALASIAAVSNLSIKSRRNEDTAGTIIEVEAGELVSTRPIGVPVGTTVTVSNLFYPVPARKKFLKSKSTEYRLILDLLSQYTLAFPDIRFTLIHNNKIVFDFPKTTDISHRIKSVLGESIFSHMIPFTHSDSYITIRGFITTPQITTKSTQKQSLFINKRLISDRLISLTVKDAYGNMLDTTSYPVVILFLTLPFEAVDVNVHPRKEQVAFLNNEAIYDSIKEAIHKTLEKYNITFHAVPWEKDFHTPDEKNKITLSLGGKQLKQTSQSWSTRSLGNVLRTTDIAQLHKTYLITEIETGIVLIDQHAAHERVLYEGFKKELVSEVSKKESFILPDAIMFKFTPSETEVITELLPVLKDWGFSLEPFIENMFTLRSVPSFFKDRNYRKLLEELIETVITTGRVTNIDSLSNKMITYLACRAAVKAGDTLSLKQRKTLIETLEQTEHNATCPHGRPTKVEISLTDLNKLFKRI
jgi:DNA mismatch repair protein MutL